MTQDLSCRKCGKAGWRSYWAQLGHEGRCRGIPGLVEQVSKIQAAPAPAAPSPSLSGSAAAAGAAPSPAFPPPPYAPPPLDGGAARLLEARISILEDENKLLKQVVLNDLAHLGQATPPAAPPSPLPWIVIGGVVLLGGLWAFGAFDGGEDYGDRGGGLALGDSGRRPPSIGGAIVSKLLDKAAGKMIDKAIGKIF
jgi:hypothetical protein